MRGIDISHYDGWPFLPDTAKAYEESDFVIVKATQWESKYKWEGYFAPAIDKAIKDGKLVGAYHYATGLDPKKEADYFLKVVKPYIGKAVLALDWEEGDNRAWGSRTWAKEFVDYVFEKTGIRCFIYTGMDGVDDCEALASTCPLWFAGYPKDQNSWVIPRWPGYYYTDPWNKYAIWQFTSGDNKVDRNITNISPDGWMEYARGQGTAAPEKTYGGKWPVIPDRGWFRAGDGMGALTSYRTQVKRVQRLVNWINEGSIAVDGKYGAKTADAVKTAQGKLGVKADGLFGQKTLMTAKGYRKQYD